VSAKERIAKLIGSASFLLLTIVLLSVLTNQAEGYEVSLYESIPAFAWASLILSFAFALLLLSYGLFYCRTTKSIYVISGILNVGLAFFILYSLPLLKGYMFYGNVNDPLAHIGFVKDIMQISHFGSTNFYPISHILVSIYALVTDTSCRYFLLLAPSFFSVFFPIFTYLYWYQHSSNKMESSFIAITCSIPILLGYHTLFAPNGLAILTIPMGLYLYSSYQKQGHTGAGILLFLYITVITFFHLLAAFLFATFMAIHVIYEFLGSRIAPGVSTDKRTLRSFLPIISLLIPTIQWFTYSSSWDISVKRVHWWLEGAGSFTPLDEAQGVLAKLDILDILSLSLKMYGGYVILGLFAFIGLIILIKDFQKGRPQKRMVLSFLILSITSTVALIFMFIIPSGMDPMRPVRFCALPLGLFGGFSLFRVFQLEKVKKPVSSLCCISVLMVIITLGIFNVHYSPITLNHNPQVTTMEFSGMDWFLNNKDPSITQQDVTNKYRFYDAIFGVKQSGTNRLGMESNFRESYVGDHFMNLKREQDPQTYLLICKLDRLLYTEVWTSQNRFEASDFDLLEYNSELEKIYCNRELDVYFKEFALKPGEASPPSQPKQDLHFSSH